MPSPTKVILVVDDERELLDIVKYTVQKDGFRVELAKNGAAAMEKIAAIKPDVVILDLMLPMISGLDVLKSMQGESTSAIPVIVMTAMAAATSRKEEVLRCPNVVSFLEKPVPHDLLRKTILEALAPKAG